ncbi:MAG: aldehyde ferredoxin oxidoreductase family protein [Candidatus Bathyarchaeia archaeon]
MRGGRPSMPYGYMGKVLRVDLSDGRTVVEKPEENFYRRYFGGRALIAYYLLKELKPGIDPLGPENVLVFAAGVATGIPISGSGRNSVGAKSPLTGGYGDGEVGGFWGAELKRAGFDAVIVKGRAPRPVYLSVTDGDVEVRDAGHLWGKETAESQRAIREELRDEAVRVAQIGPGGERLVRYACVINDVNRAAGRCGIGAVMGSKNLKAVAVRGHKPVPVKSPEGLKRLSHWLLANRELYRGLHENGTAGGLMALDAAGGLPTKNFTLGSFKGAEAISGQKMRETILVKRDTCYACAVACKRVVKVGPPYDVDPVYGGPEYETSAAFGSNCMVDDLNAVAEANQMCAANSVDTISAGTTIAFAMECFEKGILTTKDTDGIELSFGNAEAMLQVLRLIIERRGIGDLLAEGVRRAAERLGGEAASVAMHVKGQEIPLHEPRLKHGLGLGYAVSPTGADHVHNLHDTAWSQETKLLKDSRMLGILEPLPAQRLDARKTRLFTYFTLWRHFMNCAVLCIFPPWTYSQVAEVVNAATGWETSVWELLKVGERAVNLTRAFNVREGFTPEDDDIPERFFHAFTEGPLSGVPYTREDFLEAKRLYYQMMGWDRETGVPTAAKLHELDIGWVAEELAQYGRL